MLELTKTNFYKKELKLMLKRGRNGQKMFDIVAMILNNANQKGWNTICYYQKNIVCIN